MAPRPDSKRLQLPVIGHVVRAAGLQQGMEQGQRMLAHAEEYLPVFDDDNQPDFSRIPALVALTQKHSVYVTANLAGIERVAAPTGSPGSATLAGEGAVSAIARHRNALAQPPPLRMPEARFIQLGYAAKQRGQLDDAEALMRLATELYPGSWNAFDSLAEVDAAHGKATHAAANYRQSHALNPKNSAALVLAHALEIDSE